MKVFISWSGDRGKVIATGLRSWIGDVLQKVEPWLSSEDIDPGTRWNTELADQLEKTHFGIICLTPESARAPWVLFEAGALAKTLGSSRVCPYVFQLEPTDLQQPLAQFDAVQATRSGTLKLIRGINHALGDEGSVADDRLLRCFDRWWPDLEQILENVPPALPQTESIAVGAEGLGLERVFRSRSDALGYFSAALRSEMERPGHRRPSVYVTCTSMRGFMVSDAKDFHGPKLLKGLIDSDCKLHIMLTHPETSELRAEQEKRPPGAIAGEVRGSVTQLLEIGFQVDQIKYYRGAPTVFGIATSEAMLLNPYPYESESHRCMTLVVRKTENTEDIYHQYFTHHFEQPWENAVPVSDVDEVAVAQKGEAERKTISGSRPKNARANKKSDSKRRTTQHGLIEKGAEHKCLHADNRVCHVLC